MNSFHATCEYCGHRGLFGGDIELRKPPGSDTTRMACKDRKACDGRDEARQGAQEAERV